MAIQFLSGQVAVSDPSPVGPTALSGPSKDGSIKVFRLTSANFGTSAVNTLVGVLPGDSSIISMRLWVKTQLAGGGITAATINIGSASGGTQYASAFNSFGTAGAYSLVTPINNIVQAYNVPVSADLPIYVGGTATTGAPTSGEIFLIVEYVR